MKPEKPFSARVEFASSLDAKMVAIDGTWVRPCRLCDISASSAKLEIDCTCPVDQGGEFFLLIDATGRVYRRCELSWVNGTEVGVHFLGKQTAAVVLGRRVA